jgi:hypothetical protein
VLILTNPNQKTDQENLDQPLIKICGRKPRPEKTSLYEEVQQAIATTPGFEASSAEELALITEGLLEFASIAYSFFQKENQLEGSDDQPGKQAAAAGAEKMLPADSDAITKSVSIL